MSEAVPVRVWSAEELSATVSECVRATRSEFGGNKPVTAEVVAFMKGFMRGKEWYQDITDLLLVKLTVADLDDKRGEVVSR